MANQLFAKKPVQMLLDEMHGESRLRRILGPVQLTSLGVGCIIGTGIFVLTGIAARNTTGPALMVSFIVAGIACIFAALCYAEFASMIPVAGSAYAYAYATLGELLAWIIGWDLILEYAVASSTVAHGWSHYFQSFLAQILRYPAGEHPQWLDILGNSPFKLAGGHFVATGAWFDLPAMVVTFLITIILVIGIKESASFNAAMVITKVGVVLMVILIGAFYIDPKNWHPFAPYGWSGLSLFGHPIMGQTDPSGRPVGMLSGAAVIFFAYIGFDSVSTHAEEAKNPQRDVPIGIIVSLLLCTVLYILVAAVITGMVHYEKISIDAPVAEAFVSVGKPWAAFVITFGALAGLTSVLLVLMLSQARVLLAMARDGLLPHDFFGAIHERFRTPHKSTILTGIFVALPAALLPLELLAELVNIGTLLAFVIVCAAVMIMRKLHPDLHRPFRTPLVPFVPICGILLCLMLMFSLPWENWVRLGVWLLIGFIIYFSYGRYHSVMHKNLNVEFAKHGVTPGGALPVEDDQ